MNATTKEQRNYKVGFSKEMPRVWLDGPVLVTWGFPRGELYEIITLKPGKIVLMTAAAKGKPLEGPRMVNGREGGKPIIDLRSQGMFEFVAGREAELRAGTLRIDVTYTAGKIEIKLA